MKVTRVITSQHTMDSLIKILSDPNFTIPRLFPTIKMLIIRDGSFNGKAKYFLYQHEVKGNVYVSQNEISFPFTLFYKEKIGSGKLSISFRPNGQITEIVLSLSYEGWMEKLSNRLLNKWIESFLHGLEEDLRLERIKRKI
ncbi:MAG: DUF3211 domain-containing protein [Metallosphaera sp.]